MRLVKVMVITFVGLLLIGEKVVATEQDEVESVARIEFLNDAPQTPPLPPIIIPPNQDGEAPLVNCPDTILTESCSAVDNCGQNSQFNEQDEEHDSNVDENQKVGWLPQTGEQENYLVIIFGAMLVIASGYLYKNLKQVKGES